MVSEQTQFPTLYELLTAEYTNEEVSNTINKVTQRVKNTSFQRWYRAQEFADNVQDGKSYFNGPSPSREPLYHTPSQLLQCHRKLYYRQHNAPKETPDPSGIFWIGENVETELIIPFFKAVLGDRTYVQNSIWVDFTIKSRTGQLRLRGETDPAFVDQDGVPILLTEVKTKDSIDHLESPNAHHLAQVHAYMYGLTDKFDRRITDALLVYVDRTTLELKVFRCEFDPLFWRRRVLDWAASHSECRIENRLPPADPEFDWECQFCSYRERCGKETDGIGEDSPPRGFLPLHEYPEEKVVTHLEAHRGDVKLTPTIAHQFPELAKEFEVHKWRCQSCTDEFSWRRLEPGQPRQPIQCPNCKSVTVDQGSVRGPTPKEQSSRE
ncbi:CRISPR-associated protein Cas4 [Natrarchaeobaculum sulfurireducens]|uniref:RecB family exonuclease n=1 Tax=Natrarchaeobaculum sulfurireducens TaxID=2044521 RepID=A0A346PD91_9EURY|nr:PD-(D/E)XK nuclease family protein [Natrarchaeobaculum sulfurireducens]AXR77486.1 RecB family exonuclease [Natrarchaeobaculum sulfurireducens]